MNALREVHAQRPCYWLLLTSGFRTYRFLPAFWKKFYPRFDVPAPAGPPRLLDHLARARYGSLYQPATGLVRFPHPQKLRGPLRALPTGRLADPHIAHFLALNPEHAEGDELACLTWISTANLTRAGQRMTEPFSTTPRDLPCWHPTNYWIPTGVTHFSWKADHLPA